MDKSVVNASHDHHAPTQSFLILHFAMALFQCGYYCGRQVYEAYWPDEENELMVFDDLQVKFLRQNKFIGITIRKFVIFKEKQVNCSSQLPFVLLTVRYCPEM